MSARLLSRHVPAWFGEQEPYLRLEIERDVRRYFGKAAAESILPRVASAPIERLAAVWNRIPYVDSFDDLFDERWALGVERISMLELLRAAFGRRLSCGLFLELVCGAPGRKTLLEAVPWLVLLNDADTLLTTLRHQGWLLFRCPSETKAQQLQAQIKTSAVRSFVLGPMSEDTGRGDRL
jgi:hypothetical protein